MKAHTILHSLLILAAMSTNLHASRMPDETDTVYMFGSPRKKAPDNWVKFEWEKKKDVLFGLYAPTDEEKERMFAAMPTAPPVKPRKERNILVFYQCQYPHAAIATCNLAIDTLGRKTGAYKATFTDNPAEFALENLKKYDALLLNNTTQWDQTIGEAGREAVLQYVSEGGGLVAIHAGTDSCRDWPEGQELIGAVFQWHPWVCKHAWAFKIESSDHVLNKCFENKGFWHCEEVYVYKSNKPSRDKSRVLLSLDTSQPRNFDLIKEKHKPKVNTETDYTVAWIHEYGKGRVFCSSLGHNYSTYAQPHILTHYLAGIQYAIGDLIADATPSNKLDTNKTAFAPEWQTEK